MKSLPAVSRQPQLAFSLESGAAKWGRVAGVDEAGRGPLAGDVVAAAVILAPGIAIQGLDDSKRLSAARRMDCYRKILDVALAYHVASASVAEIDSMNILQASLLAMERAVAGLAMAPEFVYVDGNRCPRWHYPSRAVVKGDGRIMSVAAASILAKVTRDRQMEELALRCPGYGFEIHKGYPTRSHLDALRRLGATPWHRRSFRPVADVLDKAT